jgi:decaprenylphospho-beta-D-ribofuranose 2-oxidase
MSRVTLHGWGRTMPSVATLLTPSLEAEISEALASSHGLIARGLGRSYGDAAQLSGGTVLSSRGLDALGPIDVNGVIEVGAGTSLDELLTHCTPRGWFLPVTPGTRQVTVGGAVAADVHGKNHHVDGSFADHVLQMRMVTPSGAVTISPSQDGALFWATMGGMGLTGMVCSVTLKLLPIETDQVLVDTERFSNLDGVMDAMTTGDESYRYSVAWVDCMARGSSLGRAVLTRADHARASDVNRPSLHAPTPPKLSVPFSAPNGLLNPLTIKAFNELWFRSSPRRRTGKPQSLASFFHPLDVLGDWNRLYGRRGFVQYQFCVPEGAGDTVRQAIEHLSSSGLASFLAVLKRFGPSNPGPISFPMPGWTLALDLPVGPASLPRLLDDLDEKVLSAGGRIYFAKDARLSPDKVRAMYPDLDAFLAVKNRVDPEHQLTSDLARRLHLVGT